MKRSDLERWILGRVFVRGATVVIEHEDDHETVIDLDKREVTRRTAGGVSTVLKRELGAEEQIVEALVQLVEDAIASAPAEGWG